MLRVLVTRPQPGASETAARLIEAGIDPVVLPLTRIEPLAVTTAPDPDSFDAVAITSANAVRHAPASLLEPLAGKPCYAVGERTAQAAMRAGLAVFATGTGDALSLAGEIVRPGPAGRRVLLLCGRVRTDALATALRAAGLTVGIAETYDTAAVGYTDDEVLNALGGKPLQAATAYSVRGASALNALAARPAVRALFAGTLFVCMSSRIAEALADCPTERVRIAAEPSEKAMLALLKSKA